MNCSVIVKTLRLERFIKHVKLQHMTSLIGLALHYFARDVKLMAAASGFLNRRLFFIHSLK